MAPNGRWTMKQDSSVLTRETYTIVIIRTCLARRYSIQYGTNINVQMTAGLVAVR